MHKCDYSDRLEIQKGEIVRIVRAFWHNKQLDVYKEYEDGRKYCKNLYFRNIAGYLVCFNNENLYYDDCCKSSRIEKEYYGRIEKKPNLFCKIGDMEEYKKVVLSKYPEFKYVLKKWEPCTTEILFEALNVWKEHKEVEIVLEAGFSSIAFNKSFWKLKEKKRKETALFMRENILMKNKEYVTLKDIQIVNRNRIEKNDVYSFLKMYKYTKIGDKGIFNYLKRKNLLTTEGFALYGDYTKLVGKTNHNMNDEYWKYPSDLRKRHNKVLQELENQRRIEEQAEQERLNKKMKRKESQYYKAVKHFLKNNIENFAEGYSIYIPETVDDIIKQADKLNQCLISCDYVSKVINKKCVLVFIRKGGEPVATAEIRENKEIGQFYGDEKSECIYPSENIKSIFNQWLDKAELKIA